MLSILLEIHILSVTFVKKVDIVPLDLNFQNLAHPDFTIPTPDSTYPPNVQHVQLVNTVLVHQT
jgi:hypothetical protein